MSIENCLPTKKISNYQTTRIRPSKQLGQILNYKLLSLEAEGVDAVYRFHCSLIVWLLF